MGLLEDWDARNQRVIEKQKEADRKRSEEWSNLHFVITGTDRTKMTIWAKPSGHPFRFVDGSATLTLVFLLIGKVRNKYQYGGGWSVAVLRPGKIVGERMVRLERYSSKEEAQAGAKELANQLSRPVFG
jgi:hypothetical protein